MPVNPQVQKTKTYPLQLDNSLNISSSIFQQPQSIQIEDV